MSDLRFENVSAQAVANIYFDGKVVSHTILFADGSKKTLGLIFPGTYEFNVGTKEKMQITSGACRAKLRGESDFRNYSAGESFDVPEGSSFQIAVDSGVAQYVCHFG